MKVSRLAVRQMRRSVSDVLEDAAHLAAARYRSGVSLVADGQQRDVLLEVDRGMVALRSALRSARRWHRLNDRGAAAVWVHLLVSKDALVVARAALDRHRREHPLLGALVLGALVLSAEAAHEQAVDRFRGSRSVWRGAVQG